MVGINTLHLAANPCPANLGIGDEGNCCKFSLETINVSQENVPSAVQSAGFPFRRKSFKRKYRGPSFSEEMIIISNFEELSIKFLGIVQYTFPIGR